MHICFQIPDLKVRNSDSYLIFILSRLRYKGNVCICFNINFKITWLLDFVGFYSNISNKNVATFIVWKS